MIDFHCHLDLYPDPARIIRECEARSLYVLSVTTTPSAWQGTSALASDSKHVRTALGLHPHLAHERRGELELFDRLLPECRYVGEIGLDGAPEFRPHWQAQIAVFDHVLSACSLAGGRTMSIHSRRASKAVLDRLEASPDAGTAVLHWFSGSFSDLERAKGMGCWFSVGPAMLAGEHGRALAFKMPRDRILTESDGPFARIEGRSIIPWEVDVAIAALARIWGEAPSTTAKLIHTNFSTIVRSVGQLD
jgi:TatD DNase family protein